MIELYIIIYKPRLSLLSTTFLYGTLPEFLTIINNLPDVTELKELLLITQLNTVVMKNVNDDEIHNFVKLTKDEPLSVRFLEFMPFAGNCVQRALFSVLGVSVSR